MKNTKSQNVINHLESGKPLTKLDCFRLYSYWNLSDIILKLRKKHGYNYIQTTMKKTVNGSEYAEYCKSVSNAVADKICKHHSDLLRMTSS